MSVLELAVNLKDKHVQHAQELKCVVALMEVAKDFQLVHGDNKYQFCGPYLRLNDAAHNTIFSANSIVRYVAAAADDAFMVDDLVVDQWMEWEETKLLPALSKAMTTNVKELMNSPLKGLLDTLETSMKGSSLYLAHNQFTLADIVVGVTASKAISLFPNDTFVHLPKYLDQLFQRKTFQAGKVKLLGGEEKKSKPSSLNEEALLGLTDHSLLSLVRDLFMSALETAVPHLKELGIDRAEVTPATNAKFGDFQCNSAMSLYKALKGTSLEQKSPRDVGQMIIDAMPENTMLENLSVAGPGFINAYLTKKFIVNRIQKLLKEGVKPSPVTKKKICVDFSSPNIAKDMHVGHLRSTIIGDSMCRILEFQGHEVLRINHVGDWGTQFGMLICHLMDEFPTFRTETPNVTDLTKLYKDAKKRFDEDEAFKLRSRQGVKLLQSGDPVSREAWQLLCDVSRKEFQRVYDRLNVRITECGESFYNRFIPGVIDILKAKKLTSDSEGALVVFTKKFNQPLMMVKSDGSYLYDSTDLAALWYRLHELNADWIIYYTDYSQSDHFQLFFEVGRLAGILHDGPTGKHRVDHVGFGTVNDESGKRFKTRSGEVVRLVELLDEATQRMKQSLLQRIASGQTALPLKEVDRSAAQIGYGAVKYFDLKQSPTSGYIFSYDRMLATNGDTAVYLMFAYARLTSILRKSGVNMEVLRTQEAIEAKEATEWALMIELLQFQDVLEYINKDLMTNRLCSYLYTLSEKVQSFVTVCRVLGSPEQSSRLLLCEATLKMMQTCFHLLGIDPCEQI